MTDEVLPVLEKDWQKWVVDIAHIYHWAVAHWRPGMSLSGHYETAVQFDAAGFPDLILVHPLRQLVLFRELKAGRGKLDERQRLWRDWLVQAGADWDVWHPSDRERVVKVLADGAAVAL